MAFCAPPHSPAASHRRPTLRRRCSKTPSSAQCPTMEHARVMNNNNLNVISRIHDVIESVEGESAQCMCWELFTVTHHQRNSSVYPIWLLTHKIVTSYLSAHIEDYWELINSCHKSKSIKFLSLNPCNVPKNYSFIKFYFIEHFIEAAVYIQF